MRKISVLCLFIILFVKISEAQSQHNVLITGEGGQHDEDVKQSFLLGYSEYDGSSFEGNIELYSNHFMYQSFNYAEEHSYDIIIQSTAGMSNYINIANEHPTVKLFMPSGINSFIETFSGNMETNPIIVTGAGIDSNVTGYQIDFFAIDPIYNSNLSSFSNGYIAGQIAFISEYLGTSIEQARAIARSTSSNNGSYSYYSGYGRISVENAISYSLPVELVNFNAKVTENEVLLRWMTATELNNYGWEIQRAIHTLNSFETIEFVGGAGNSNSVKTYSFIDHLNIYGSYFYRIKQIDFDGTFEYSNTINVDFESTLRDEIYLSSYPNPFNPECTVTLDLKHITDVSIGVYNILGQQIKILHSGELAAGKYEFNFNGNNLASGTYVLILVAGREVLSNKIILIK